jgi:hypothetical protein
MGKVMVLENGGWKCFSAFSLISYENISHSLKVLSSEMDPAEIRLIR